MEEPRWGLGEVLLGLSPFALSGLAIALSGGGDEADPTISGLVGGSIFLWLFLVGVPAFATRFRGNGLVADLGARVRASDARFFVLGVALQAVAVPLLYLPVFWLSDRTSDDVSGDAQKLIDSASGIGVAALVLVVAVGAPIAEELFFRGFFLRAARRSWGTGVALVVVSVVFAASHFQGLQFPALLLFAGVSGWLALRYERLGPSVLCHMGFNAWTLFLLLVIDR